MSSCNRRTTYNIPKTVTKSEGEIRNQVQKAMKQIAIQEQNRRSTNSHISNCTAAEDASMEDTVEGIEETNQRNGIVKSWLSLCRGVSSSAASSSMNHRPLAGLFSFSGRLPSIDESPLDFFGGTTLSTSSKLSSSAPVPSHFSSSREGSVFAL